MALVDYDYSSDEEDEEEKVDDKPFAAAVQEISVDLHRDALQPGHHLTDSTEMVNRTALGTLEKNSPEGQRPPAPSPGLPSPAISLPSPVDLFDSPASFGAGTPYINSGQGMESRKRVDTKGNMQLAPYQKVARGGHGHMTVQKHPLDTGGGQLLPPQLRGRSNIVTEDLGLMFSRRPRVPSGSWPSQTQE